jgi:TRAP-type C4-dicarboxylate transport system substrate-binding protein
LVEAVEEGTMKQRCVGAVLCGFLLSFVAISCVWAQEKTVNIRFSTFFPPSHEHAKITADWAKEVEKRTEGRVKVRHYAGGTLNPPTQTYDSMVQGVVDAGTVVLGYTSGKFPLSEVLDYPLGYPNGAVATRLMNAYYAKFKPKELSEVQVPEGYRTDQSRMDRKADQGVGAGRRSGKEVYR